MSDDPNIHRLTLLLADAITGDAQGRGSDDYAQRDSPGRALATVDGREYVITVVANTEQAMTLAVPPSEKIRQQRELLDLAMEFYVRVPIPPLSHVVVRREMLGVDRWAVTNGSLTGLQAWMDGRWQYVSGTGRQAAFRWPLERAMEVANEAAEHEAREWERRITQGGTAR